MKIGFESVFIRANPWLKLPQVIVTNSLLIREVCERQP